VKRWLFVLGVVAGLVGVALLASRSSGSLHSQEGIGRDARAPLDTDELCHGSPTTVAGASEAMPFTVLLPNDSAVPGWTVTRACQVVIGSVADGGERGVVFELESGAILRERVPVDVDLKTWAETVLKTYPDDPYQIETVRGVSALVLEPGGPHDAYGGVEWVEDDVWFEIEGNGKTQLTDLIDLAESLKPASSVAGT
jgi:hypothetical protein